MGVGAGEIYSYLEVGADLRPKLFPRNISVGVLFHPKVYENLYKVFRLPCIYMTIRLEK